MTQAYNSHAKAAFSFVLRVIRILFVIFVLYMFVGGAIFWTWPWSLIALEVLALIWCLVRSGEGKRYSLRGLLILTAGVAVIMASAAFVPGWLLAVSGIGVADRIVIEVVDEATNAPISSAGVVLTQRDDDLVVTTYQGTTDSQGVVELPCEVSSASRRSILRGWRTYDFDGWLLEAKAQNYRPAKKILSDVTIEGERVDSINFHIELQPTN